MSSGGKTRYRWILKATARSIKPWVFLLRTKRTSKRILRKINSERLINVSFYVREAGKWNMQELFDWMGRSRIFSPRLVVFPYLMNNGSFDLNEYERNMRFYRKIDPEAIDALSKEGSGIKNFGQLQDEFFSDIIFFQQPWIKGVDLFKTSRSSLNVYTDYAYILTFLPDIHFSKDGFHNFLHIYFCQSELHKRIFIAARPEYASKLEVSGYPKFDGARRKYANFVKSLNVNHVGHVIYAPHHSIGKTSALRLSTFDWNHIDIFYLAEQCKELNWVYRPHPVLKYAVEKYGLMSMESYMEYEAQWATLPNARVSYGGNYLEMFFSSRAMITDCSSFLAEYLLTGKPLIRLISRNDPERQSLIGERINEVCYRVHSVDELKSVFRRTVINGDDPLLEMRLELRNELFPSEQDSAKTIVHELLRRLGAPEAIRDA